MKIILNRKPRGIAIVIVLVSIFILAALAGGFAYSMKVETKLAMTSNDDTELEWLGRSGVEYARFLLAEQLKNQHEQYDSLDQIWAGGEGDTNDPLSGFALKDVELGKGKFTVTITDTERKYNINQAVGPAAEPIIQKALISIGADAADVPIIISSIEDWIDPDNDARINGAENEYYQGLNPPYNCKNGPIDDISELLFIKGITPDLYWGPDSTNHPAVAVPSAKDLTRSALLPTTPAVSAGLVDLFTPISNGKINILTASEAQLQILPIVDDKIAGEIITLRQEGGEGGTGLPYHSPADLLINTSLGRQLGGQVANYCTFRSSTFEVQVVAEIGQSKRTCHALLLRNNPKDVQLLTFWWD